MMYELNLSDADKIAKIDFQADSFCDTYAFVCSDIACGFWVLISRHYFRRDIETGVAGCIQEVGFYQADLRSYTACERPHSLDRIGVNCGGEFRDRLKITPLQNIEPPYNFLS